MNTGTEWPARQTTRIAWSVNVPWRTAAQTPSGMPISAARMRAAVASSKVAGKKRTISVATGFLVRTDMPKSPWASW
ncbi:hypothetical protein D3C87_1585100 [compost metagenome]